MPINEYMNPLSMDHRTEANYEAYAPINFNYVQNALKQKQSEYDAGEAMSTNILNNIKVDAIFQKHREAAPKIREFYQNAINSTLEKYNNNYAAASADLVQIGKHLQDNLQTGDIARINSATAAYKTGLDNIAALEKESKISGVSQKRIHNMEAANYENVADKEWFSPYSHSRQNDINDEMKNIAGALTVDENTKVNLDDPNYIKTITNKGINRQKVTNAFTKHILSLPNIEYDAKLELGIHPNEPITKEQLNQFALKRAEGYIDAKVQTIHSEDYKESATGQFAAKKKSEEPDKTVGIIKDFTVNAGIGGNAGEINDNYLKRNENLTKIAINTVSNLNSGAPIVNKNQIQYQNSNGEWVTGNMGSIYENPELQKAIKNGSIRSYDGKGFSPGTIKTIQEPIVKQLNFNGKITNSVLASVNNVLEKRNPDKKSITLTYQEVGTRNYKEVEISYDEQKRLMEKQLTGGGINQEIKTIGGKKYSINQSSSDAFIGKSFVPGVNSNVENAYFKELDGKAQNTTSVVMANIPSSNIAGVDVSQDYKLINNTIAKNLQLLTFYGQGDTNLEKGGDVKTIAAKNLGVDAEKIASVTENKDQQIQHTSTKVGDNLQAFVPVIVTYTDGTKAETTLVNKPMESIANSGLNTYESLPNITVSNYLSGLKEPTPISLVNRSAGTKTTITYNPTSKQWSDNNNVYTATEFNSNPVYKSMLLDYIKTNGF